MADYSAAVPGAMARSRPTSSGSGDEDWAPQSYYSSRLQTSTGNVRRCKVDRCGVDLSTYKTFYRRAHCCQLHARELMVFVEDVPKRLCQQCSAFHPLADFDGTKKSCRIKLQAHKIRQREHSNRRIAEAAAAMHQQASAEADAVSFVLPAAAPCVQLPDSTGGLHWQSMAHHVGQLAPQPDAQSCKTMSWGHLQQPAPWQQPQQVFGSQQWTAMQEGELNMQEGYVAAHRQRQQQQQQQQRHAADVLEAPDILADIPLDELLLDMPMDMPLYRQPSWEQQPNQATRLSSIQEAAPPYSCQGVTLNADAAAPSRKCVSIGEVDLRQPLPLIEVLATETLTAQKSIRSMSHDAGADRWGGWADTSEPKTALGSSDGATKHNVRASPHSRTSQQVRHGSGGANVPLHRKIANEEACHVPSSSPFQWSAAQTSPGGTWPPEHPAVPARPAGDILRSRSTKRNSCDLPTRQDSLRSVKRASLGGLRTDSALIEGCGDMWRPAAAAQHGQLDLYRRASLDSHQSAASTQTGCTQHPDDAAIQRFVRGDAGCNSCAAPVRRPIKRRSLSMLPDAAVPDLGLELDRAFLEQAPEPLYFAAQLVKGMGLQSRLLPEFSYRCSSTGDGLAPTIHETDASLRSCSFETADDDALSSEESQMSEDIAAVDGLPDDVWDRLRQLSRNMAQVPLTSQARNEATMSRRIRRRSCDEGEMYCGLQPQWG